MEVPRVPQAPLEEKHTPSFVLCVSKTGTFIATETSEFVLTITQFNFTDTAFLCLSFLISEMGPMRVPFS